MAGLSGLFGLSGLSALMGSFLPYFIDFSAQPDGALPSPWIGATWTISGGQALNTPSLGADLVVNGDFAIDANWNKRINWTIAGGKASHAPLGNDALSQTGLMALGHWYQAGLTILDRTAGQLRAEYGGNFPSAYWNANGNYEGTGRSYYTVTDELFLKPDAAFDGSVDDVTLRELTTSELFATMDAKQADVTIEIAIAAVNAATEMGIVMNLDDPTNPQNFVTTYTMRGRVRIEKCVAGTYSALGDTAITFGANKVLKLVKTGTTYRVSYDGVQVGADETISDAGIINNTIHGMLSTHPDNLTGAFNAS